MAHNVPAVYDVLPAAIKQCVALRGWQNVPEQRLGHSATLHSHAVADAEPPTGGEA
jgi:hypothetical protein